MDRNATYVQKFQLLKPWILEIVRDVKKDLKNEHLKADKRFFLKYFSGKAPAKLSVEELADAYYTQIVQENDEGLAEFVCSRWLLKHTDLYEFFAVHLKGITDDFDQLEQLPQELGDTLVQQGIEQFGGRLTYLFAVINSVVFSQTQLDQLKQAAEQEQAQPEPEAADQSAELKRLQREIARIENRYEKKLSGLQRKYINDTEALKKQVVTLQRKLSEGCSSAAV